MCVRDYYSPPIRRDLVAKLYWKRKQMKIPMTNLINLIVEDWFDRMELRRVFAGKEATDDPDGPPE